MYHLSIRIDFAPGQRLGPGKVRLLEEIDRRGSIRGAASAMKMSYRRAWLLLKAVEEIFGVPLVETSTGGPRGGGARLTQLGRDVVSGYRQVEERAGKAALAPAMKLAHGRLSATKKPVKPGN